MRASVAPAAGARAGHVERRWAAVVAVRSKRLYGGNRTVITSFTAYTVPANTRTIVKQIAAYNGNVAANRVVVQMQNGANLEMLYDLHLALQGAAGDFVVQPCWHVLHAGDVIVVVSTVQPYYLAISGAELAL